MAYGNLKYDAPLAGSDIRFDDVGSLSYVQAIKLIDGTPGSSAHITGDSTNGLDVDVTRVGGNVTIVHSALTSIQADYTADAAIHVLAANGGTFAVQIDAALPAGTANIGDVDVLTLPGITGNVAHDAADSGNPIKIGGVARSAQPAAVAAGDRVDASFDLMGRQLTSPGATWQTFHQPAVATQATTNRAAAGAGIKNVCTALSIYVTTAATAPTAADLIINLRDGATGAGTVLMSWLVRVPATTNTNLLQLNLTGLWIAGSANTAMTLETSAAPGANVRAGVNLHGTTTA